MNHTVQQAIEPAISLQQTLNGWGSIKNGVAESFRKRRPQLELQRFY